MARLTQRKALDVSKGRWQRQDSKVVTFDDRGIWTVGTANPTDNDDTEETIANAKLFAASKELLNAAIDYCEFIEENDRKASAYYIAFKKAIAKATE